MDRLQIAFFGATNSGKSTLVNALAGQEVSLVSELPGTTTDPVRKAIELPGLGPCILVDTAGYGDSGALGAERERRSRATIDATDIAVLLRSGHPEDDRWLQLLRTAQIPVVEVQGRTVIPAPDANTVIPDLIRNLQAAKPEEKPRLLTGGLVGKDDIVVLVMPQDNEAPKGRLILPQVQVLRELLDLGCIPVCCQPEGLQRALDGLSAPPALTITDSQAFAKVNAILPADYPLTSFSILLAGAKGDIRTFVEGAKAIGTLRPGDHVLIAEACTHVPDTEDIGRVKIPALLRKKVGGDLAVTIAAGNDFPDDLTPYNLIIQCGGCVATERLLRSRIRKAILANVPITNYGITLAYLTGILNRVVIPGE
ncbi:MAG: 50S ribosome-binding GTPase [Bacteroidales bacterium]|nr:50S ribosome-binding GTPase [Bacteroidales bacterium]